MPLPSIPALVLCLALIRLMAVVWCVRGLFAVARWVCAWMMRTFGRPSAARAAYKDLIA